MERQGFEPKESRPVSPSGGGERISPTPAPSPRRPSRGEGDQMARELTFFKGLSLLLLGLLLGGIIVFAATYNRLASGPANSFSSPPPALSYANLAPSGTIQSPGEGSFWIAELAERSLPFVVNIQVVSGGGEEGSEESAEEKPAPRELPEKKDREGTRQYRFGPFFFELPEELEPKMELKPPFKFRGEGSGFVISEDGYIVTNYHVIAGGDEITVTFLDGTKLKAKKVGADPLKDIAVIKVEPKKKLPYARLGDSDKLRVGEPAIAIGSPFGLQHTVTAGIISALGRTTEEVHAPNAGDPRGIKNLIQTDAAINRGNSGGPLLNWKGEVIGINEAIIPAADRIGFAIPINEVKKTIKQLMERGDVRYPGMGIMIIAVSDLKEAIPDLYDSLEVKEGVFVQSVTKGGAADKAGIRAGDVILAINGTKVTTTKEVIDLIMQQEVGDRIRVLIARDGKKDQQQEVVVVLQELKPEQFMERSEPEFPFPLP